MIKVEVLSKRYARNTAVDNISFEVQKGQIVGFLGPNGAGKTTTMRMLTCFMPPSSGSASVAGFDVLEQPFEVKKRIGYLPETPPLYPDMEVHEYLNFVGRLKGLRGPDLAGPGAGGGRGGRPAEWQRRGPRHRQRAASADHGDRPSGHGSEPGDRRHNPD